MQAREHEKTPNKLMGEKVTPSIIADFIEEGDYKPPISIKSKRLQNCLFMRVPLFFGYFVRFTSCSISMVALGQLGETTSRIFRSHLKVAAFCLFWACFETRHFFGVLLGIINYLLDKFLFSILLGSSAFCFT
jgi:hypothetical protein